MAEYNDTIQESKDEEASGAIPLTDIFFITLHHWPWILLSVAICVGAAFAYLLRTPNVYSRSAEILIKDDKKGQSISPEDFSALGMFQSNTNIQNEMSNIKSKDLMEEVVRRLNLDVNYYKDGTFHDVVVYGYDLPVKLTVLGYPDEASLSMDLNVSDGGKVTISDLISKMDDADSEERTFDTEFSGKLNDTITTPVAKLVVTPSRTFEKGEEVELIVKKIPVAAARDSYTDRLAVKMADEKGTVLNLTIADQSKQRADEVLSTLIGVYNENWIRDKNQIAVSTSNFITDRLGVIEGELGHVDSDISSYKSATLVPDLEVAASMYMGQSQQTQAQMLDVNNQLSMARYIRSYLTSDGGADQLLPANTGLENSNIQSLIGEYNESLLQRNSLVAKSSDKNPLVATLDDQLASQRQAIIRSIDNEIVALNTQLKSLRGSEAQTVAKLASNPTQAKNLLSVERQQKVKESLYLFLLQKREENELSQAFTAYNTRIVNKPGDSGTPPTPNRRNILAIAFLIGLAFPFGVTYIKETTNTKVRGRKDVEKLATPFLGEIPQSMDSESRKKSKTDKNPIMVVKAGHRGIINEAFRVLRTNVDLICGSIEGCKVIALTSFNPNSGKSFIAGNLGMALSLKGKRVLLIDGDMRHCSTSEYIGNRKHGLSDYLSGKENDLKSLIVKYDASDSLYFLPVGTIPPNPTELLEQPRFGDMISNLKEHFDYIIVDCPPIEVVADTQIIDQYADRTFFIVRAGLLERSMLVELDRMYKDKRFKNMAFILNGTRNDKGSHSYRYGYGYGYGYGYHYGSDSKNG